MKAAFVHDHNFVFNPKNGLYYDGSGGAFDKNLWLRYLQIFEELIVVGRKIEKLPNRLIPSSTNGVSFTLIEGASGVKNVLRNKAKIVDELEAVIKQVDFVIIRLPSTLGRWAFSLCKKLKKKCVLEIVGDPFEAYWYHGSWLGKVIAPLEMIKLKRIVRNCENVIYVTRDVLQRRYPCPNRTQAISNVRLEEVVNKAAVTEFYCSMRKGFKIGLIGSFHVRYKGHIEALKALRYLKEQGYTYMELNLVGTGDGSWVQELARQYQVEDQVKIVGALSAGKKGVMPFLDEMDLYIHPSKTEGLPRVILEAMSRGRICLGSDVGGTRELLSEEYIHKPGAWRVLAKHIEAIVQSDQESKLRIAHDNLRVAECYTEPVLQRKRVDFIKEIINL